MKVPCQSVSQHIKRGVAGCANFETERLGKANNFPVITLSPSPISLMALCFKHFSFNGALIEVCVCVVVGGRGWGRRGVSTFLIGTFTSIHFFTVNPTTSQEL